MKPADVTDLIENNISEEKWKTARRLIKQELDAQPRDHWLLARLALTYYEEKDYETALRYASQAGEIVPDCPLVLWELAGALDMTGRPREAMACYGKIIMADPEEVSAHPCREGPRWLLSLKVDAAYRAALCADDLGRPEDAIRLLRVYLNGLECDVDTIYGADEALQRIRAIRERTDGVEDSPPKQQRTDQPLDAGTDRGSGKLADFAFYRDVVKKNKVKALLAAV